MRQKCLSWPQHKRKEEVIMIDLVQKTEKAAYYPPSKKNGSGNPNG